MKQPSNWIEGMSMELKKKKKLAVCVPFQDLVMVLGINILRICSIHEPIFIRTWI